MKDDVGYFIKRISNHLEAGWNAALKCMDVTGTQLWTMEYLYHCAPDASSVSHIAAYFGVKHTSALHVLRLLEKKGHIVREQPEKGQRCGTIRLTDSGVRLVQGNESRWETVNQIMFAGISAREQQELLRLLRKVSDNLDQHDMPEMERRNEHAK